MYLFSCNTNSNFHPRESKIFIRWLNTVQINIYGSVVHR
jgi:hypothetical protein